MSSAYIDTSAVLAVVLGEPEAGRLTSEIGAFEQLWSANLLEAEFRSALKREGREDLSSRILPSLHWLIPSRRLEAEIERVVAAGHLRGADLWHLACALYLSPEPRELPFLTLDREQGKVARKLGFRA